MIILYILFILKWFWLLCTFVESRNASVLQWRSSVVIVTNEETLWFIENTTMSLLLVQVVDSWGDEKKIDGWFAFVYLWPRMLKLMLIECVLSSWSTLV